MNSWPASTQIWPVILAPLPRESSITLELIPREFMVPIGAQMGRGIQWAAEAGMGYLD